MVFRLHTQTDYRSPVTEFRCQHVSAAELTRSAPHRNIICVESKSVAAYTNLSPTLHDSSAHDLFIFKEDPTRRRKSTRKRRKCANNFSCRLRNYVVLSIFMRQKNLFFFFFLFFFSSFLLFPVISLFNHLSSAFPVISLPHLPESSVLRGVCR